MLLENKVPRSASGHFDLRLVPVVPVLTLTAQRAPNGMEYDSLAMLSKFYETGWMPMQTTHILLRKRKLNLSKGPTSSQHKLRIG
jgi:hypothetical protein